MQGVVDLLKLYPPLWGGDQSPNAMRPRGAMGGVQDVPINETSPQGLKNIGSMGAALPGR